MNSAKAEVSIVRTGENADDHEAWYAAASASRSDLLCLEFDLDKFFFSTIVFNAEGSRADKSAGKPGGTLYFSMAARVREDR